MSRRISVRGVVVTSTTNIMLSAAPMTTVQLEAESAGRDLVSESTFTAELAKRAEQLGFAVWPLNQTRGKPKFYMKRGVADLVMFGHGVTLWVETKVDRNQQSEQQKEFERCARAAGSLYWCVRTMDEWMLLGRLQKWWK